ncbi:hypothetical protein [Actinoallomurus sp. NPDC050550]|uniref:hypothetical protein n=1 Tax=Actinoallomurus sp. NPDC050550 TaxID=3154937 RepID=UPI0033D7B2E5
MKIGEARRRAGALVESLRGQVAVEGAYLIGSTATASSDLELPATSDLDVMVVVSDDIPPPKPGKVDIGEAVIEVSFVARSSLLPPERAITDYHLAHGLRHDSILLEGDGWLRRLHEQVAATFTDPRFVTARCENAHRKIKTLLGGLDPATPWHQRVSSWLFGTGVMTHVILVAALRNPTVRVRYVAARSVLHDHGLEDVYGWLLRSLGCETISPEQANTHLALLAQTFDQAAKVATTPFPFSSDITTAGRRLAIDGSQELIDRGDHREAEFWMVATMARCVAILTADGTPRQRADAEGHLNHLLGDLGITGQADLRRRARDVLDYLPTLMETADTIVQTATK